MYGRKVDNKTLSFGHMGILYRKSFIMYDRGTESHWVHTTGECVKGEMKGKKLKFIASVITPWGTWKKQHPETKVLSGKGVKGFMGTYTLDRSPEKFGISVGAGDHANLYRFQDLKEQRVVQDQLNDRDIVVFFNAEGNYATAWNLTGKNHKFSWDGSAIVDDTGTKWDMMRGRPVDQPESDDSANLSPLPATAWLVARWKGFYPDTPVYNPDKKKSNE